MKTISVDYETYPFSPRLVAPKPVALAWFDGEESGILKREDSYIQLAQWLDDKEVELVWHYAAFDMLVLAAHRPKLLKAIFREYEAGRIHCTMYREKLINLGVDGFMPHGAYGLDKIVKRRYGKNISDAKHGKFSWRKRYHYLDHLPLDEWPEDAVEYILSDVYWTLNLYESQKEPKTDPMAGMVVAGPDGVTNEAETNCAAFGLSLSSAWGFKIDRPRAAKVEKGLREKVDAAMAQLKVTGIYRKDGSKDMTQLRERIGRAYEAKGEVAPATNQDDPSKKSNVKYDEVTLAKSGDPMLELMASISSEEKQLSSFTKMLKMDTMHPGYDALKHTGRSSSFKPNIQQLPREGGVRECLMARPGYMMVLCDYSTMELRALAQVVLNIPSIGWSKMAETLKEGLDLHLQLGASIMGIDYAEAEELYAAGNKEMGRARSLAKVPNFGIPGGMSNPYSLVEYAEGYGFHDREGGYGAITVDRARHLMDHWWRTWPEMEEYFAWIDSQTDYNGDSTVVQHVSGRIRAKTRKTAAANSYFQGLAADGGRYAIWEVQKAAYTSPGSDLYGSRVNAYVHDELVAEVPICNWRAAALELKATMERAMATYVPDVPVVAEAAVAARWFKSAEPVFTPSGDLEVWVPHSMDEDSGVITFTDDEARREAERKIGREIQYAT